jgi:riboflavin kinase/FMN adenylyltransferase
MKVLSRIEDIPEAFPAPILTMGNFDGVHMGHQTLFRLVKIHAQQLEGTSLVLTFDPHPQKILFPDREFFLINHMEEKIEIIRDIGVDVLICLPFTKEFAATEPKTFVREVLVNTLHIQEIYVGYNSRFGLQHRGTPQALTEWGKEFGFQVTIVPPITWNGIAVSSTKIRHLLTEGEVETAAQLLNRPYAIDGEVVRGTQRGSTLLGYPTANVDVHHELIPRTGVYICRVIWDKQDLPAVVNIGTNPTFQQQERVTVEAHILDFQNNLYGERIKVAFLKRLRDELIFSDPHTLIQQITQDVQVARTYCQNYA